MVDGQQSQVVQLVTSFIAELLLQFLDFRLNLSECLWIAEIVGLDIRLGQHGVVHAQVAVEPQCTHGRQERLVALVIACCHIMRYKASKIRHYHAVIGQQQYLNMSL